MHICLDVGSDLPHNERPRQDLRQLRNSTPQPPKKHPHHGNPKSPTHPRPRCARFRHPLPTKRSASGSIFPALLTPPIDLTGSAPALVTDTTAGLSHSWPLETKYYTATLPIWIDEIPSVPAWRAEFIKPEAREVVTALGAWIYCFRKPVTTQDVDAVKEALKAIADVIEKACGYGGDMVCLAVAMPQSTTPYLDLEKEEWEETCLEHGFEYVDSEAKRKNEFGEEMGVKRVEEALKANEWEGGDMDGFGLDEGDDEFGEFGDGGGLDAEEREMGQELFGMKNAIHGLDEDEGEETQVEELESMMRRMVAIKGTFPNILYKLY
jgi:hypothetical protein